MRRADRHRVFSEKKHFSPKNGALHNDLKTYLSEDLTMTRRNMMKQLAKAKARNDELVGNFWSFNGNIFVIKADDDKRIRLNIVDTWEEIKSQLE